MIVGQLIHEPVETRQLVDGVLLKLPGIEKVLVTEDNHPELSAPVADVIVAGHFMPLEFQDPVQSVADHAAAKVADVHRLGDVRRRIVDHDAFRLRRTGNAQTLVGYEAIDLACQPVGAQFQIDKPRAGDLGLLAKIGDVEPLDDFRGHLAWICSRADLLGQGHRAVCLIVAEAGVLGGLHHRRQRRGIGGQPGQGREEAEAKLLENIHRKNQKSECRKKSTKPKQRNLHQRRHCSQETAPSRKGFEPPPRYSPSSAAFQSMRGASAQRCSRS